jgi:threonylcarbamoyladenosine tRNA methylthiotransferase MtaB
VISIALYTLGCKVNQLETEGVADSFRSAGFTVLPYPLPPESKPPDLLVVNTCTVTSKAEQKARRIIRAALDDFPNMVVLATGCYAQMDRQSIESLESARGGPRRVFTLPGDWKSALVDLPEWLLQEGASGFAGQSILSPLIAQWLQEPSHSGPFRFTPKVFSFHSRGFLKIQDGCDNRCAYCRVALARGPSVSLEASQVLAVLREMEEQGYGEAVLTGINLSQYRDGSKDLSGLLEYLLEETGGIRLRLSSLEPDGINRRLLGVLREPRIRPHVHLSVQSGSASILKRMGRRYGPEEVEQAAALIRSVKDDPFLGCDIIAGFPGETEEAFERTCRLCRRLDFAWIHPFPYSRRPGTAAYSFKEPVSEREIHERVDTLTRLGNEGRRNYIRRWLGRTVEGTVETGGGQSPSFKAAVSENYLKLLFTLPDQTVLKAGDLVRCRLIDFPDSAFSRFDALAVLESLEAPRRDSPL